MIREIALLLGMTFYFWAFAMGSLGVISYLSMTLNYLLRNKDDREAYTYIQVSVFCACLAIGLAGIFLTFHKI